MKIFISLCFFTLTSFNLNINNDVVLKFEKLLKLHFESYKTNAREGITKLGGGWVKENYCLDGDYNYDIQTTNSLISPYTAYCEFTLKRSYTAFHNTKDEAKLDSDFINSDKLSHKHFYSYKKDKWIVSERQNKGYSKWYNSNEEILIGGE